MRVVSSRQIIIFQIRQTAAMFKLYAQRLNVQFTTFARTEPAVVIFDHTRLATGFPSMYACFRTASMYVPAAIAIHIFKFAYIATAYLATANGIVIRTVKVKTMFIC